MSQIRFGGDHRGFQNRAYMMKKGKHWPRASNFFLFVAWFYFFKVLSIYYDLFFLLDVKKKTWFQGIYFLKSFKHFL